MCSFLFFSLKSGIYNTNDAYYQVGSSGAELNIFYDEGLFAAIFIPAMMESYNRIYLSIMNDLYSRDLNIDIKAFLPEFRTIYKILFRITIFNLVLARYSRHEMLFIKGILCCGINYNRDMAFTMRR